MVGDDTHLFSLSRVRSFVSLNWKDKFWAFTAFTFTMMDHRLERSLRQKRHAMGFWISYRLFVSVAFTLTWQHLGHIHTSRITS